MELFQGQEPFCSGDGMGELRVFTWRRESSRESSSPFQSLKGLQESWKGTGDKGWSDRTKGKGFKLKENRKLGIKKKFFPVRAVRPWHGLFREAVAAPGALEVSKARLDGALSKLGQWKVSHGRGLE
ncbi:hypothetical protein TURU_163702 [Turdus rufiventris]|nr:hypothetical protein TURU_163702 [Turdus rufiventris]